MVAWLNIVIFLPLQFIYSDKATKFCKISPLDLSYVVPVKSTVEISQYFVAFSEYMYFNINGRISDPNVNLPLLILGPCKSKDFSFQNK